MSPASLGLRICVWCTVLILAATIYGGVTNGPDILRDYETTLQLMVGITEIVYVASAIVALVGLWRRAQWALWATGTWALACTAAAPMATIAWDDAGLGAVIAALLGTAAVTALGVWCVARYVRPVVP